MLWSRFARQTKFTDMKRCLFAIIFCFVFLFCSGAVFGAQDFNSNFDTIDKVAPAPQSESNSDDLLLDQAVKFSVGNVATTLAFWRDNYFTSYVLGVSVLAGFAVGILAALLAHYGADPRSKWKDVRKMSTWLAAACGLGIAVLLVGLILSIPGHGRLTYLVFSAVTCALGAVLACSIYFVIARRIRQRRAEKSGLIFNQERMQGF